MDTRQLIPYMENNPVMAAYGAARYLEAAGQPRFRADPAATRALPMEWDVWLDPEAPADLARCRIAHGVAITTIEQHLFEHSHVGLEMPDVAEAAAARNWLNLFGRAIACYRAAHLPDPRAAEARDEEEAIAIASAFLRAPSGLILDCKSTYSSTSDLNDFIHALKAEHDIDVIGVGTFQHQQLDSLVELFLDGFAYGNLAGEAEAHADGTGLGAQKTPAELEADGL